MKQLVNGLNDCSNLEYHSDRKYLSSSVLKTVLKSLDEYKKYYIDGEKKTHSNQAALDEGSLAHAYILEPHLVEQDFLFYNGFRKSGPEYDAFVSSLGSESAKKPIISTPQKHRVKQLVETYEKHLQAPTLMQGVQCEQTICGTLHEVPIKVRFDAINSDKGYIVDIKTTGYSGEVDSFKQTLKDLNYELSAALYCSMAEQYYGKPFDFYFIVLSKRDIACYVYKTSEQTMNRGKRMVLDACLKYKKAVETNCWTEAEKNNTVVNEDILEV